MFCTDLLNASERRGEKKKKIFLRAWVKLVEGCMKTLTL